MTTDTSITIPAEAVEAAAKAAYDRWRHLCADQDGIDVNHWRKWDDLDDPEQEQWREQARAAIAAGLEAWPMKHIREWDDTEGVKQSDLILPLPTEPSK